jgi:hypothetical protein
VIKNGGVNTKVFGDNIAGGMSDPVVDVERRAMMGSVVRNLLAVLGSLPDFVKIGVIKDQEKLVLVAQALHSMCHALGEIPNVTIVERLNLVSSELVDSRNQDGSRVHEAPLGHTMPMQLTNAALGQMLLRSRDVVTLRKILNHLLAEPSPVEKPCLGVREAPLEIWHNTVVCGLLSQVVGVGEVDLFVGAAWIVQPLVDRSPTALEFKRIHTKERTTLPVSVDGLPVLKLRPGLGSWYRDTKHGMGHGQSRKLQ